MQDQENEEKRLIGKEKAGEMVEEKGREKNEKVMDKDGENEDI